MKSKEQIGEKIAELQGRRSLCEYRDLEYMRLNYIISALLWASTELFSDTWLD